MSAIVNAATLALIREFEGFVDHWYPDAATGGEPYTCCYGHTSRAGDPRYTPAQRNRRFTLREGEEILLRDVERIADAVEELVTVPLTPNQMGALVSFAYNVGPAALRRSSVLANVNAERFGEVPRCLARWNRAAGRVMAGLVRRRRAETALFEGVEA